MSRRKTGRMMSLNNNLVCRVFRSLEDVCSRDIEDNPFVPFRGAAVIKCDESKFNHKAKVSSNLKEKKKSAKMSYMHSVSLLVVSTLACALDCRTAVLLLILEPITQSIQLRCVRAMAFSHLGLFLDL